MERQTDSQYDDDLTVGIGDYDDESIDTGYVDLFEFSGDEESPIARLKTIVLSIDWEITDEVLTQFNDELLDLQDIWGDDPVKLVYVQALQKIGKYIFQQKSNAHPNAIKLLLTFFYDLEKIVLDEDLSDQERKEILRADVKKFEQLKRQIDAEGRAARKQTAPASEIQSLSLSEQGAQHPVLFNLKACILGMDWEITDRELRDLSNEIRRLEEEFAGSKPRMLFLQGLDALGGYIKLKRSNAHADAFKLLYSFYEGLEKIVVNELSIEEQKAVLFPEVDKFETFKKIVAPTLEQAEAVEQEAESAAAGPSAAEPELAPAFADVPDDIQGFQAEQEAAHLGDEVPLDVADRLDRFFADPSDPAGSAPEITEPPAIPVREDSFVKEAADRVSSFFDSEQGSSSYSPVSTEQALRGVDVETEADDDSDEDALPTEADGRLSPALADMAQEEDGSAVAEVEGRSPSEQGLANDMEDRIGEFFDQHEADSTVSPTDAKAALAGVDVETPADDDTDELALPLTEDEELAPALTIEDEEAVAGWSTSEEAEGGDIEERLDSLFADQEPDESTVTEDIPEILAWDADSDENETPEQELAALSETVENDTETLTFEDEFLEGIEEEPASGVAGIEGERQEAGFIASIDAEENLSSAGEELPAEQELDGGGVLFDVVEAEEMFPAGELLAEAIIDEDEEIAEGDEPRATFASDSDENEFFASINERVEQPGEFQMELLDEADDLETRAVATLSTNEGIGISGAQEITLAHDPASIPREDGEEDEELLFSFSGDDDLSDLRAGIASLGVEINEAIIGGILSAVNSLRHTFTNRPVEKTFLQLISTIVQHIGQYRYEASSEAHGLLLSVFDKLELVQNPEIQPDQAQEILLAETTKVLLWQQRMLDRQAIKKGDELTFVAPVRSDETVVDMEIPESLGNDTADEENKLSVSVQDDDFSAVFTAVDDEGSDDSKTGFDFDEISEQPLLTLDDDDAPQLSFDKDDAPIFSDNVEGISLATEEEATTIPDQDSDPEQPADDMFAETQEQDLSDEIAEQISSDVRLDQGEERLDPVASYVKTELDALRKSLNNEIGDLRKRLEDKKS